MTINSLNDTSGVSTLLGTCNFSLISRVENQNSKTFRRPITFQDQKKCNLTGMKLSLANLPSKYSRFKKVIIGLLVKILIHSHDS
jgi:hypothetical protein